MSRAPIPPIRKGSAHPLARFSPAEAARIRLAYAKNPRSVRQMTREEGGGCARMTMYRLIHYLTYEDS